MDKDCGEQIIESSSTKSLEYRYPRNWKRPVVFLIDRLIKKEGDDTNTKVILAFQRVEDARLERERYRSGCTGTKVIQYLKGYPVLGVSINKSDSWNLVTYVVVD